ncbi:putative short-chain dehydrogenase reductase sdr [Phaeomoniella chlamydospora]|uniref:Putative short-chain dehydrogenase reductase sdr n=1 Tax=Phaeomoniella chlamydospora TaxID=158046 RepID=A0A0G2EPV9_PHACM|nr:putative short-chain dehydrogenase reductase sdr [Phaeomoniella chlamydospora]
MASTLQGKVIIITGAASGIGRATAIKLASQGAIIAACDINNEGLDEVLKDLDSENHQLYTFDVGSSSEVQHGITDVISHFGKIDYIFNCAGINPTRYALESTTDEYWDTLVNTNLRGTYNVTRACIPHLAVGSAFVNVSSTAGLRATAGYAIYNATKFGIIGFSKAMALELGPRGIRVNVVAPGPINTPTNAAVLEGEEAIKKWEGSVALGRLGNPEEVAEVVAFLFSGASSYMNGSVVEVHGGM